MRTADRTPDKPRSWWARVRFDPVPPETDNSVRLCTVLLIAVVIGALGALMVVLLIDGGGE